MDGLYEKLKAYGESDFYPMHMPGHKRRLGAMADPITLDITEIDGFDNLHHAEGILREAQENAARLYGSEKTYFLVNGSTSGILTAIGAACPFGGKILMGRNSHQSAYHAVYLGHLTPVYLYPETSGTPEVSEREKRLAGIGGRIRPEDVAAELERDPEICAVFITSPTYDGVVSDVAAIARIAHSHQIPLIVDEAHGAHFGMHPIFPENSVRLGADFVIHSLHKTLPSLTQTALLHVNGMLADRVRTERLLNTYMTSSPSYVLMASMDRCIRLLREKGPELFDRYAAMLGKFDRQTEALRKVKRIRTDDPSKIIITCPGGERTGPQIAAELRSRYHIEPEMTAPAYVLCLTGIGDDREGFDRLAAALSGIEREMADGRESVISASFKAAGGKPAVRQPADFRPGKVMEIHEAWDLPEERTEKVLLAQSRGRVSCEFACLYPPGIPMIAPGERIPQELPAYLEECIRGGFEIHGLSDFSMKTIRAVK